MDYNNKYSIISGDPIMKKLLSVTSAIAALALTLCACEIETNNNYKPHNSNVSAVIDTPDSADDSGYDPYTHSNYYDVGEDMIEEYDDVDNGTLLEDVTYYSSTASDNKQCNILLPADYDKNKSYPVLYVFHGFEGSHNDQISERSYLRMLYGNMLHDSLTVPMIIVNVDMYTDKLADKDSKTEEQLRFIYDRAVYDVAIDLMPYIEKNYSVKKSREYTAVAGVSEGGAKALCTGFQWLDKFGYIGSFAPGPGVIPTEFYKGTFWNTPFFDKLPTPTKENTPSYLYLAVGSKDPWNIDCTKYYSRILDDMGINNQTDIADNYEHDAVFWRQCFYNFLNKIFR